METYVVATKLQISMRVATMRQVVLHAVLLISKDC
jgi:hypothetical protein